MEVAKEVMDLIYQNIPSDKVSSTRLFHGRGKLFSGFDFLSIDYFAPTILITLFKKVPADFLEVLQQQMLKLPLDIKSILLQHRYLPRPEMEVLVGELPEEARALEHELEYMIKFQSSQNVGFFLDMSMGRRKLIEEARDKRVLNLFSYTCSLSVAALKGGATHVVNVDMSKAALKTGEMNHRLNQLELKRASFLPYDILCSWNNIKKRGPYDLIIIDPPSDQGGSFKVERDYPKIIKRLEGMLSDTGEVWACLNSPHLASSFLTALFQEHAPMLKYLETHYGSFASMEQNPEQALKMVVFSKTPRAN